MDHIRTPSKQKSSGTGNSIKLRKLPATLLLLMSSVGYAGDTDISQDPLFINASAPPNLMMLLDDSGSMDWDILTIPHWQWREYDPDAYRQTANGGDMLNYNSWKPHNKRWNRVTNGSWHSHPGICEDRNKDGECFTKIHLNCDDDYNDCAVDQRCYTGVCVTPAPTVTPTPTPTPTITPTPTPGPTLPGGGAKLQLESERLLALQTDSQKTQMVTSTSIPTLPPGGVKRWLDPGKLLALLTGSKDTLATPPFCEFTSPNCPPGQTPQRQAVNCGIPGLSNDPNYCESDKLHTDVPYHYLEWQADNVYRVTNETDKGKQCSQKGNNTQKLRTTASTCATVDAAAVYNDPVYSNDPWPIALDWRIRSSAFNILWYNPSMAYTPWHGLSDATFNAVHSNPQPGTVGHNLQTKDLDGFVYEVWIDDSGYCGNGTGNSWDRPLRKRWAIDAGLCPPAPGDVPPGTTHYYFNYDTHPNAEIDLWDTHRRYTVYSDRILVESVARKPNRVTGLLETTITHIDEISDSNAHALLGDGTPGHTRTRAEVQQNIANWYEFARKRSFVAKGAISFTINEYPSLRYGLSATSTACKAWSNTTGEACPGYGSAADLFMEVTDNDHDTLITNLYNHAWPGVSTPLRSALEASGKYFQGTLKGPASSNTFTSPITSSCQNSFSLLLTDGYWMGPNPTMGNEDNDSYAKTLADVASYFYQQDLSTVFANEQHMGTIGIGFGVKGRLNASGNSLWPTPSLAVNDDWAIFDRVYNNEVFFNACGSRPSYECPAKLDDLWHAAFNSEGLYLNANSPEELKSSMQDAIAFASQENTSASSGTTNNPTLTHDSKYYESSFLSGDWSGNVTSFEIDNDTATIASTPRWDAQSKLDSMNPDHRKIITYADNDNQSIEFSWSALTAGHKASLNTNPETATADGRGSGRLDFLRGGVDPSIRDRQHVLGDIVHSAPVYVGPPSDFWLSKLQPENSTKSYAAFSGTDHPNRTPMIYVGANDGMLHAFEDINTSSAPSGAERFAYIPSPVIKNMNQLTRAADSISHTYFVDATPVVGDVFYDSDWHTVLVGALGAGGQGIYALDITDPPALGSAITAFTSRVLWEFTDQNDADLGYTFSQPIISRVRNGSNTDFRWVAIFGNGYNNTEADGALSTSTTGEAALYVIDIETGALVKKISTSAGSLATPNGLATPTVVDMNGDYVADYVYAGDLLGNMWRFDLMDISAANWDVSFGGNPLFTAKNDANDIQPITTPPSVIRHPGGISQGTIINFGTGKFLGIGDVQTVGAPTQSFYGIWDSQTVSGLDRSDLFKQSIMAEIFDNDTSSNLRVTSASPKPFPWSDGTATPPNDKFGWYLDLIDPDDNDNHGERIVTDPQVLGDGVLVNTLLPPTLDANSCGGGSGWKMLINAATGGRLEYPPFDLNDDHAFNGDDMIEYTDPNTGAIIKIPPSGVKSSIGILSTTVIIGDGSSTLGLTNGSDDGGGDNDPAPCSDTDCRYNGGGATGRTSWSELRY